MERGGFGGALDALTSALRMPAGAAAFGTWGLQAEAQPQGFGTWGGPATGREATLFDPIALFEQQANEELARMIPGMATPTGPGQTDVPSSPGGNWAPVDRWNNEIGQAQARVQRERGVFVPSNVIKAVMMIESSGNPGAGPAYGLMQVTGGAMGSYNLSQARNDPAYGLWAGVNDLALRYLDSPGQSWDQAITGYFSGHYVPNGATDSLGTSDYDYLNRYRRFMTELQAAGSQPGGIGGPPTGGGYGGDQFTAIWGGGDFPVTQEQGVSGFSQANCDRFYSYAPSVGLPACSHPGVDVGVPYGTALYTPVAGTVITAGGSGYYANAGDKWTPGVGEFRLQLANGDILILGHMSQIGVQVGQVLPAGAYVGRSGTEGSGAHVHVEYRTPSGQTSSGWQVVEPRQALGGGFTGGFGAPGTGMPGAAMPGWAPGQFGPNFWNVPLEQLIGR